MVDINGSGILFMKLGSCILVVPKSFLSSETVDPVLHRSYCISAWHGRERMSRISIHHLAFLVQPILHLLALTVWHGQSGATPLLILVARLVNRITSICALY